MAFALIANIAAGSPNSIGFTTGAIDTTGADLLAVILADYQAVALSAITDVGANIWVPRTSYFVSGGGRLTLFYAQGAITVGSGHTFTVNGGTSYPSLAVMAFSGAHATPYGNENGATTSSATSRTSGSITPPENGCLIISGCCYGDTTSLSVDEGMTIPSGGQVPNSGGLHFGVGGSYKFQTTATAINPSYSWTNAVEAEVNVTSFKAAAAAATAPFPRPTLGMSQAVHRAAHW